MDLVTITDHDSIDGASSCSIAHPDRDDVIIGEEVSCWFPDGDIEVHFGVYGMTEALHRELQPLRAQRVRRHRLRCGRRTCFFALNHLLHFYRGQVPLDAVPAPARRGAGARGHATARCCPRTTSSSRRLPAIASARSSWAIDRRAATRTRCAGSAARGPRRRAATREEFLASLRAGARPPRRASWQRRCRATATRTASWRATWRALSGFGPARQPRLAARGLSRVHRGFAAVPVLPVAGRAQRQVARSAGGAPLPRACARAVAWRGRRPRRRSSGDDGRASPITGIGLVTALGDDARRDLDAHARGRVRHPAGDRVRRRRLSQPDRRAKWRSSEIDAPLTPLERRRWSRGDRIGVHAADEALHDSGLLDSRASIARASACCSAPAPPICCATRTTTGPG